MYLYGASGHAKVIIDILEANQIRIDGLIDDNPEINELLGYPVFHQCNDLSPLIISIVIIFFHCPIQTFRIIDPTS